MLLHLFTYYVFNGFFVLNPVRFLSVTEVLVTSIIIGYSIVPGQKCQTYWKKEKKFHCLVEDRHVNSELE